MFKYTKSLLMVAMALSCSLTLVACGGGGGGGGGGAEDTTTNGSSTNGSTTNGGTTNGGTTNNSTVDYAWSSGYRNANLKGTLYSFFLSSNGSVVIKQYGNFFDGTYTYTKTGTNTGRLVVYAPPVYPEYNTISLSMTINFSSSTSASIPNTSAVGFYTIGNTTW